ncbi:SpoIIE family protein phosphatase [Candidatus Magnetomonas plexicatena]|uniref:SpoIIE family protein phosphatase n=1 Tax=Candidatus Magnetomonas plexicatena TaxID=2552947 RepID=UPI001C753EBC|nr:SpoIIE family protein phosphatase [Nitrospirales bacterium LBB_01]
MTSIYASYLYSNNKKLIMENIDGRLLTTAYGFKFFADPYHDIIAGRHFYSQGNTLSQKKDSISVLEYTEHIKQVLGFYEKVGVEAAYTLVHDNGKFYFTLDTPSADEFARGKVTPFYYPYKDASIGLKEAYKNTKTYYDNYRDEWGKHRSVFLPTVSSEGEKYVIGVDVKLEDVQNSLKETLIKSISIGMALLIINILLIYIISSKISRALSSLSKATGEIAMGNLDTILPNIQLGKELATLTDSFDNMKISLKNYIREQVRNEAEKQLIENQLKIAHDIQMDILPLGFPAFAGKAKEFDLVAFIKPAQSVGGDLYDYILIDDDNVFFTIGDVSGKGIAAALFMAITMTLVKSLVDRRVTTGEILTKVNQALSLNNETSMFVTMFSCILNTQTGLLYYSNGGHNPPIIVDDNGAEFLKIEEEIPLGIGEHTFTTHSIQLKHQTKIFLYTDGVTEAENINGDMYSESKLLETVKQNSSKTVTKVIDSVYSDVLAFSEGAKQFDDITMLAVQYFGTLPSYTGLNPFGDAI